MTWQLKSGLKHLEDIGGEGGRLAPVTTRTSRRKRVFFHPLANTVVQLNLVWTICRKIGKGFIIRWPYINAVLISS
jgi:hypothetical protein